MTSDRHRRHHVLVGGNRLVGVHAPRPDCFIEYCCIHWPSNHHMKDWPQLWREDLHQMERICEHGIGHPDPDDIKYIRRTMGEDIAARCLMHGCDGCCSAK